MVGFIALLSHRLVWYIRFPYKTPGPTENISYWEAIWLAVKLWIFGYLFFVGSNPVYI